MQKLYSEAEEQLWQTVTERALRGGPCDDWLQAAADLKQFAEFQQAGLLSDGQEGRLGGHADGVRALSRFFEALIVTIGEWRLAQKKLGRPAMAALLEAIRAAEAEAEAESLTT
ncbi:MAG: hypothetical protein QJR07_20920 [Acetobacteraceae bacterium]|nr:hypothetical protein [Acetobacteraceae bacterium]